MAAEKKKKPRQESLPEMEDREIKALSEAALAYAEIRDQRQDLTRQEVEAKTLLLSLMKKHKKESYTFGDVQVNIVHEQETVKVKIKKAKPDSDDDEEESE